MRDMLSNSCILSKFYIKPQHVVFRRINPAVVSYRNSTSNHNSRAAGTISAGLYLIEILHQTTTIRKQGRNLACCILSKFYIKPQPQKQMALQQKVVSYRNSTSNHNKLRITKRNAGVVSYRNSTSNHNSRYSDWLETLLYLIEILHQTTTVIGSDCRSGRLYLIEILHQTTTFRCQDSCQL